MLKIDSLSFAIRDVPVLNAIHFEVHPGQFVAILGPNGSGKSTLLKLVAGEYVPETGSVSYLERPLNQYTHKECATFRAYFSTDSVLNFPFTVYEVVELGFYTAAEFLSVSQKEQSIQELLQYFGIAHLANQRFLTLSSGQRQRVQFARVLAQIWHAALDEYFTPRYLLLDEPISNVDPQYQHTLLQIATHFAKKRGGMIIAVLHDLNLAARYADRILLLNEGKQVDFATPLEVLTPARIHDVFHVDATVLKHPLGDYPLIAFG